MKTFVHEYNDQFSIILKPEDMAEAALLVRMGMNVAKAPLDISVCAYRDSTFDASLWLKKVRTPHSSVSRKG